MTPKADLAGLRVLVVEDEYMVSMLIEGILDDLGCIVSGPFGRLGEAMEGLPDLNFDVALLDVNLAGERSYPIAEILENRQIPFMFLSGYGLEAVPNDRLHWTVCAKPFKAEEIASALLNLISKRG